MKPPSSRTLWNSNGVLCSRPPNRNQDGVGKCTWCNDLCKQVVDCAEMSENEGMECELRKVADCHCFGSHPPRSALIGLGMNPPPLSFTSSFFREIEKASERQKMKPASFFANKELPFAYHGYRCPARGGGDTSSLSKGLRSRMHARHEKKSGERSRRAAATQAWCEPSVNWA